MQTNFEASSRYRFNAGDSVRVRHDLTFFSVHGVDMTITEVVPVKVGGNTVVQYRTNRPDPVHGGYYNEDELVGL